MKFNIKRQWKLNLQDWFLKNDVWIQLFFRIKKNGLKVYIFSI